MGRVILAEDLTVAEVGTVVSLTAGDTIRGRLEAVNTRLGMVELTVDGQPFVVFPDTLIHLEGAALQRLIHTGRAGALARANDQATHELLTRALLRGRRKTDA